MHFENIVSYKELSSTTLILALTMTAPIVQLVCLLVVLAFSYGEEVNASNPVVKFYCEADHIKNISTKLGRSVSYNYIYHGYIIAFTIDYINIFTGD